MAKNPVEVEVAIETLAVDGLGGGGHQERPIWVRNALPGEVVSARIVKRRGGARYADGQLLGTAHPERIPSACQYFPRCGGCVLQHASGDYQLAHKQGALAASLKAQGVEAHCWRRPSSLVRLGYRTKARLGVRVVGGQVLVGFRESFSNRVAKLQSCQTLTPELSALIQPLKSLIGALSAPASIPQVELAQGDDARALMLRHLEPLNPEDLGLLTRFAREQDVQVILQSGGYDTLQALDMGQGVPAIKPLAYQLPEYGLSLLFQPDQFTQVNALMNRELIRTALAYLMPRRGEVIADLFCGIGNFSLPLARSGARVVGIEASERAIASSEDNAGRNGLAHRCHFKAQNLYTPMEGGEALERTAQAAFGAAPSALLLDPPRSGAGERLADWAKIPSVERVAYVSCNPETFAADARTLAACGYRLHEVGVYDMFPNTSHIETLGFFVR